MLCIECKCCAAQEGFDLCVFCEDAVPCPGRQKAARAIVTPAPSIPLAPVISENARSAARRIRKPKPQSRPAPTDSGHSLQESTPQPQQAVQVSTAGEDRKEEKETTHMNTPRICQCKPGCTEIAKSNASPYAKGHNPNLKKKEARPSARKSRATPPPAKRLPNQRSRRTV